MPAFGPTTGRSWRRWPSSPTTRPQIDALRAGDLAGCFGPAFAGLAAARSAAPAGRPDEAGRSRRRSSIPTGGRFGLGLIRAEADIHPDDWFLTCHFVDDQVMPGTLMYECCLHTLRIFLMRMGWVGEAGRGRLRAGARRRQPAQVPRPGHRRPRARSTYEVTLKEIGYRPEPYAIADALMYADGKPIVEITDMSLRLTGPDAREAWRAVCESRSVSRRTHGSTS